ncbi:unnamed protein product [Sympodiomycopsis kandeliae]
MTTSSAEAGPSSESGLVKSQSRKFTFNSGEILSLSSARVRTTRLPDLAHIDSLRHTLRLPVKRKAASSTEKDNRPTEVPDARHGLLFLSYMQDADDSGAPLSLCNDVDYEPCPAWDFHYTNGWIHSDAVKGIEKTRRELLGWPLPAADFRKQDKPARALQGHIRRCDCGDGEDGLETCNAGTCQCQEMARELDPKRYNTKELKGRFAYNNDGRLALDGALLYHNLVIFECTDACGCDEDCPNRVVQKGRQVPLEVFKTKNCGWGIRTRKTVKAGTFITVYGGELLTNAEAESRALVYDEKLSTTYLNDIEPYVLDIVEENPELIYDDDSLPSNVKTDMKLRQEVEDLWAKDRHYSIDAGLFGNISRFFNHSCDPNMVVYHVYTDSVFEIGRPWLAYFTIKDVQEGQELTFSYSLPPDDDQAQAVMQEMNEKQADELIITDDQNELNQKGKTLFAKKCHCGAPNCAGVLWANSEKVINTPTVNPAKVDVQQMASEEDTPVSVASSVYASPMPSHLSGESNPQSRDGSVMTTTAVDATPSASLTASGSKLFDGTLSSDSESINTTATANETFSSDTASTTTTAPANAAPAATALEATVDQPISVDTATAPAGQQAISGDTAPTSTATAPAERPIITTDIGPTSTATAPAQSTDPITPAGAGIHDLEAIVIDDDD